ncbi:MAG: hypothetical protein QHC90_23215 [Shinella sp.]|nr:hypothetical protein [Shinella sp.]
MRTRYIPDPMAPNGYMAAPIVADPIFTPIFTAIGFSTVGIAGTTISAVTIASALAAGGDYWEPQQCQQ